MNYYTTKDKKIKLFNKDCIDIFECLFNKGYNDRIDLIICDPPYKVTGRGNTGNTGGMLKKKINKQGKVFKHNDLKCEGWFEYCYKLLKDGGHCYIMCNHTNLQKYLNTGTKSGFHFI